MSWVVRLRPEAEDDLSDAVAWYECQKPGLGRDFLDEVSAIFDSMAQSPLMYQVVHRQTRRAVVHRFPFGVYFRVEADAIVVVAVVHGSRSPGHWKSRY